MSEEKEQIAIDEVFAIVGAAMEVHRELGPDFRESVYLTALKTELQDLQIPFASERALSLWYKGRKLATDYRADLICYEQIIVELKVLDSLSIREESQLLNCLKATGYRVGLLINFGSRGRLEWKRLVN